MLTKRLFHVNGFVLWLLISFSMCLLSICSCQWFFLPVSGLCSQVTFSLRIDKNIDHYSLSCKSPRDAQRTVSTKQNLGSCQSAGSALAN